MRRGRFTAELTEDDGSKVKVTVDAKDPETSLERFLTVLTELGATDGPGKARTESFALGAPNATDPPSGYSAVRQDVDNLLLQGTDREIVAPWPGIEEVPSDGAKSKMNNVMVLMRSLPRSWFTSKEVRRFYEERFGVRMNLSTISMYLGRLASRGSLARAKSGRSFKYRVELSQR
jgi:hypothetical protein